MLRFTLPFLRRRSRRSRVRTGARRSPSQGARTPAPVVLTLWTDDPVRVAAAVAAGVDRIGVDFERACVPAVRAVARGARLVARTRPLHAGSEAEVGWLLEEGARVLVLPGAATPDEVRSFVGLVGRRAAVVLEVDTIGAALRIDELLGIAGVEEVHLGLEGLSRSLGLAGRFAALAEPITAEVAARARAAGKRFGFGGLGRVGDASGPVPSDLVYAQCARLRAGAVGLDRAFGPEGDAAFDLAAEVARTREQLAVWRGRSSREVALAHGLLTSCIERLAASGALASRPEAQPRR